MGCQGEVEQLPVLGGMVSIGGGQAKQILEGWGPSSGSSRGAAGVG